MDRFYYANGIFDPVTTKIVFILAISVLAFCAVYLLLGSLKKSELRTKERLKKIAKTTRDNSTMAELKDKNEQVRFSFIKVSDDFRIFLLAAGVRFKPQEFIVLWGACTLLIPLILWLLTGKILLALLGLGIGFSLPLLYVKSSKKKRLRAFGNQLGDALLIMANCLRSGFTFRYAMERVSEDLPDPIASEFARVIREVNLGMSLDESLGKLAVRMQSDDMKLVNSAVNIQQKAGGNIADIIDKVAATIRERIQIQNNVKTLTAQGRYSGILIGCLPIALLLIFSIMSPQYVSVLYTTDFGRILLLVAGLLEVIGFFVINKMTNVKY